jgi:hypothetical protein
VALANASATRESPGGLGANDLLVAIDEHLPDDRAWSVAGAIVVSGSDTHEPRVHLTRDDAPGWANGNGPAAAARGVSRSPAHLPATRTVMALTRGPSAGNAAPYYVSYRITNVGHGDPLSLL